MSQASGPSADLLPVLPPASRVHFICLGVILLTAGALRFYHLGTPSFWFDEVASVVLACGHWEVLFTHLSGYFAHAPDLASPAAMKPIWWLLFEGDSHPPLYVLILRGWWTLFGMSDVSCRSLSVLASLLGIIVLFDVAGLIAGPTPAVWACAIMAVSPVQIQYAREARAYALLALFGLAACDALLRLYLLGFSRRRMTAFGIFATAALLTHYFVAGAIASMLVFIAVRLSGRTRSIATGLTITAFALLLASRLPTALAHRDALNLAVLYLDEPRDGLIGRTIFRCATLPAWFLLEPRDIARAGGTPAVMLLIIPFIFDRRRPGLLLAGLWSCGIIGLVAASDIALSHNALLYIRYTIAAAPMVYVAMVVMADLGGRWLRHALPALAVIGGLLGIPNTFETEIAHKTEARAFAADLREHMGPDDVLVVASAPDMGLYSAGLEYPQIDFYGHPLPCAVAILEAPADEETRRQIWSHKRVWVANCYYGAPVEGMLGPCRIVEMYKVRYQIGRLMRVEEVIRQ